MDRLAALIARLVAKAGGVGLTPLRGACIALALTILLLFAPLMAYFGYAHAARERNRVQQEVLVQARALAALVETYLTARLDGLKTVADTMAAGRGNAATLEAQLRLLRRSFADLTNVLVVDERGSVLASIGQSREAARARDSEWLQRGATAPGPFVGEPRQTGPDLVIGLYAPSRGLDGQFHGAVAAQAVLVRPRDLLGHVGLGVSTVAEIVTTHGVIVAREPLQFRPREGPGQTGYPDLLRGEGFGEVVSEDGVRRLVGAAMVPPAGWVVAVGRPANQVGASAWKVVAWVAGGGAVAVVVGLVLALPMVRRTTQSLGRLGAAMSRLEFGDIPSNVPVTVSGDAGALTEAFNRVLGALRRRLGDYKALSQVEEAASAAIAGERPVETVLTDLLRNVVRGMDADLGVALLQQKESLVTKAAVGPWGIPMDGIMLRRGQGLAGAVVASRQVTIVRDTESDDRADEPYLRAAGLRSVVAAPMVSRDQVIGVVELGYRTPRSFTETEVERLSAMVRRTVQAFEHAQALEVEPDLEARVAILRRLAALDGAALTEDLAVFIASEVPGSIRDLEACLTRLLAFGELTERELSRDLVEEFLEHVWHPERRGVQSAAAAPAPTPFLAIVRRGATDLFQTLKQYFEKPGVVEVIWDRRERQRRRGMQAAVPEQRRGDRRQKPPPAPDARDSVLARRKKS